MFLLSVPATCQVGQYHCQQASLPIMGLEPTAASICLGPQRTLGVGARNLDHP